VDLNHEVHTIGQVGSYFTHEAKTWGACVHELDFWRSRFDLAGRRAMQRALQTIQPELAHFHGGRAAFFALKSIRQKRWPSVYTVHGFHFYQKREPLKTLAMRAESAILRSVTHCVFVCEDDRVQASKLGLLGSQANTSVIYNGFDAVGLPIAQKNSPETAAFLGRLNPQKDPLLMVEIAALLAKKGCSTVLIGGGEMEEAVRQRIAELGLADKVSVTGALPREQALEILSRCTVFVLPSRWEGFPISILEAMAIGLPVVAAKVNGVPEAVVDGETGTLIESRHPQAFAKAVQAYLKDKELYATTVERARNHAVEKFSLPRCLESHSELYQGLTKS